MERRVSPEQHQALVRRVEELERARAPVRWSRRAYAGLLALFLSVVLVILGWASAERSRRIASEEAMRALEARREQPTAVSDDEP